MSQPSAQHAIVRCRLVLSLAVALSGLPLAGCVRRTLSITSEPPGALVMLNDREVGRTPVEVEFLWYGDYDVRLSLEGHEPLVTKGVARPPLKDTLPLDLLTELSPGRHQVRLAWHYTLEQTVIDDASVIDRARKARASMAIAPPMDSLPTQTSDDDQAQEESSAVPE